MNWDAVGAIAESLGAAGVIISLGYLGVQIKAARASDKVVGDDQRFDTRS